MWLSHTSTQPEPYRILWMVSHSESQKMCWKVNLWYLAALVLDCFTRTYQKQDKILIGSPFLCAQYLKYLVCTPFLVNKEVILQYAFVEWVLSIPLCADPQRPLDLAVMVFSYRALRKKRFVLTFITRLWDMEQLLFIHQSCQQYFWPLCESSLFWSLPVSGNTLKFVFLDTDRFHVDFMDS